ncbi:MAG: ATP-binding protein [Sphingobium limneticum]
MALLASISSMTDQVFRKETGERSSTPFFTSKREQGGTGLGLAIARSLLEAYRADLSLLLSSQGAHFRLLCPLASK